MEHHPFPSLLLTPSPSPESSSRGPSPAPPPAPTTTASVALKRRRQLFDLHSTSPEWTASDQTLLRARLERAGTNQGAVLLRRGQPARVLSGEERERLRREMEEEQRSDGSSAVGSWVTEDGLVAPSSEGSPPFPLRRRGIGGALDRADGQRRKGNKASEGKGMYEHIEYVVGRVDQGAGAEVSLLPPRPTTTHTTSLSLGLGPPTPASSLDAAFPFALLSKHNAPPSPPRKSIRIEGFALAAEVETGPTPPPSSSWSLPKPPPPTPASFSVIASLLTGSRPATPSPSSESQHNSVEAPQFRASVAETPASSGESAGLAASTVSEGMSVQPAARRSGMDKTSRPTASPRQLNSPTKSSTLPASSRSSSNGTLRRPSNRRATTSSSASPPAALGVDSSLSLSFARRPTMTRQGSMGESFGKLYEGEKAAKRERAMRMLEVRERGGLAAMGMGRERRGSRSPRSVGEVEVLEFEGDESASEGSEEDSEVEVVCDAFETSVFASARSNSATSLSSASSLRCTSPTSSIFPHPHRNRSPRSYSSSSTSGSSPSLLPRTTAPFRPTFPRTPSTSPSVSRRASFTRQDSGAPAHRAHTSSDPGPSPLAVAGLGIEPAREEEREDRARVQRMVRESRRAEEVRRREEAMEVVAGAGAGRKDSGMGGAMRRLFGLGSGA